ncbi:MULTISPECIES: XrtA/PEP-CTERM system-associated ATPase [Vibrio]|uniref:AAA family ATPase n=2 Tax=Vibrio TaxID=662 RepID=A0A7X4LQ47_9VIBR|nr:MULTISPECIES: XrtA/PEP-CTERM system-associated ATPase [Vibrio]MBF9002165.1 AAA family ATPase [Vibrio nitrifigilis]MZI96002.1 AAA family ATPase [Vibrio eleionomae]
MYESHFGLSGKPFKLSPDPHFFYGSPHHSKAISYLRYGLESGEGFIVITGPVGTGKTTIARSLLSSLDESITAIQLVTTHLTPDALINMIASNFGLQVEGLGKSETLKRLEGFLNNLNRQGKRALLVIDEAQNLPSETIEELRMLSNFQVNDKPLIQSFLLGQEELKPIIELPEMEQFRQRIIASCHLETFNIEQTREYILHRLKVVGWDNNPRLDDKIFALISQYTGGVARKINIFMDRLFLYAFMENIQTIDEQAVRSVIDEMGGELSGGLQSTSHTRAPVNANTVSSMHYDHAASVDSVELDNLCQILAEVNHILDDVVSRKTLTIKHLDRLIREKRKLLSNRNEPSESNRLVEKRWLQQLIKEREL